MKRNFLTTLSILFTVVLFTSCESEKMDELTPESIKTENTGLQTVPIEETLSILSSQLEMAKGSTNKNSIDLNIDLQSLKQVDLTNTEAKLNIVDASTKFKNVETQVLQIRIDGEIQTVLFHQIPESNGESSKNTTSKTSSSYFTGSIYSTDLSGNVLSGFSVSNGNVLGTFNFFTNSYMPDPEPCWGIACGITLDEVIIGGSTNSEVYTHHYYTPQYGHQNQWGRHVNNYSTMGIAYANHYWEQERRKIEENLKNELTSPCARDIFVELEFEMAKKDLINKVMDNKNGEEFTFAESILKLFNDAKHHDYTIKNGNLSGGENGNTVLTTTTLNNDYLKNATQLSIARTIIHEMVHAYINAKYYYRSDFNSLDFHQKLADYARDNGFTDFGQIHHEFMGQYVDAMALSLMNWDIKNGTGGIMKKDANGIDIIDWGYYKSMAYAGLKYEDSNGDIVDTESYKALVPDESERDKINKIIIDEQDGKSKAKGEKCD